MTTELKISAIKLCFALSLLWVQVGSGTRRSETLLTVLKDLISSSQEEVTSPGSTNADNAVSHDEIKSWRYTKQIDLLLAELQAYLSASEPAQAFFVKVTRFGLPSFENLLFRDNYILSYDNRLKHPNWVLDNLTKAQFSASNKVEKQAKYSFLCDPILHKFFRSKYDDYSRTGYERGHMTPVCNNMADQRHFNQSFLMSNFAPQVRSLNTGGRVWTRLERYIIYMAKRSKNVYTVTGTLYAPAGGIYDNPEQDEVHYKAIGRNRVGVPSHFYKVIVKENHHGHLSMEAFLMPNCHDLSETSKLEQFRMDIDTQLPFVERMTGLKFFALVNRKRVAKPKELQYGFGSDQY